MAIRKKNKYVYLVSSCLAGMRCTYNGKHKLSKKIRQLVETGKALPVCPELLGGSTIPRASCEIQGGGGAGVLDGRATVVTPSGRNISIVLIKGAAKSLGIAKKYGIGKAILKSKSPSCGAGRIYDGTFTGRLIKGDGVTTALLRRNGITVRTEKD